ncbi:MAG TPA: ATP-binding cassette domain-containing protein [Pseudonocardiaceae bacterium]|nr:ATP-binding cassette domain-containing protein [Pseudonocardiaceae bacterium]
MSDQETPSLRCEHLTKHFGGVTAVDDVSLSLPRTGLYGLCGPNGAGKSTLFNLLAGAAHADSGRVELGGVDMTGASATARARAGVTRTWQAVQLLEDRSVLDNVAIGYARNIGQSMISSIFRGSLRTAREKARAALDDLNLGGLIGRPVGALTLEGQRMVELARAVVTEPFVVLADEPASGLSRGQRLALADFLVELAKTRTMLVVEHDIEMLERISTKLYAMMDGRLAYEGDVTGFRASPVRSALRGTPAANDQLVRTRDER